MFRKSSNRRSPLPGASTTLIAAATRQRSRSCQTFKSESLLSPCSLHGQRGSDVRARGLVSPSDDRVVMCIAFRYAKCVTQFVTRVDAKLAEAVDALVSAGVVRSRSEAVRMGLLAVVERHRRQSIGDRIARGYSERPQTDEELAGLDEATRSLIAEEPW